MIFSFNARAEAYLLLLSIGRDKILPIQYSPARRCYIHNDKEQWLPKALHDRIIEDSITLNTALGYDMNSVEFAIEDSIGSPKNSSRRPRPIARSWRSHIAAGPGGRCSSIPSRS